MPNDNDVPVIVKIILAVVTIIGAAIAAWKTIVEMRRATDQRNKELEQRKEELTWRRAQAARDIIQEMHQNKYATDAATMFDWKGGKHEYVLPNEERVMISYDDVLAAVKKHSPECTDRKEAYIRDCIDWFLYNLDRIEHYINIEYIKFTDIEPVLRSYVITINEHPEVYQDLIESRGYKLAKRFLLRYH